MTKVKKMFFNEFINENNYLTYVQRLEEARGMSTHGRCNVDSEKIQFCGRDKGHYFTLFYLPSSGHGFDLHREQLPQSSSSPSFKVKLYFFLRGLSVSIPVLSVLSVFLFSVCSFSSSNTYSGSSSMFMSERSRGELERPWTHADRPLTVLPRGEGQ